MFVWILRKMKSNEEGFTLIELVVVIAILAILAAVAIPRVSKSRKNAAVTAHNTNVNVLMSAANMYVANSDTDKTEVTWEKSDDSIWKNYVQEWPKVPKGIEDNVNEYTVTIDKAGNVKVVPKAITDNN